MFGWLFGRKKGPEPVDPDAPLPLSYGPRARYPRVGPELDAPAAVLVRHGGPDTHEWHDVQVRQLFGEHGKNDWVLVREAALAGEDWSGAKVVPLDAMIVVRDAVSRREYRGIEDVARFFRLIAGGMNARDRDELPAWEAERATARRADAWREAHGEGSWRKPKPSPTVTIVVSTGKAAGSYTVTVERVDTWGGHPARVSGPARRVRSRGELQLMRFTLPGTIDPENEIASLTPEGAAEPAADVTGWLTELIARTEKKARGKP